MSQVLEFDLDPERADGPVGFAITARHGGRSVEALERRFGRGVWDGGDGAPELNRAGNDPNRPWM